MVGSEDDVHQSLQATIQIIVNLKSDLVIVGANGLNCNLVTLYWFRILEELSIIRCKIITKALKQLNMKKIFCVISFFCFMHQTVFGKQWIVFCARDQVLSLPHAYLNFIKESIKTNKPEVVEKVGFNPNDLNLLILLGTTGDIAREDIITENYFAAEVNEHEYQACWITMLSWQRSTYQVTDRNCLTFIKAVAENLRGKLKLPDSTISIPGSYVRELKRLNQKVHNISLRSYYDALNYKSNFWSDFIYPDGSIQFKIPDNWKISQVDQSKVVKFTLPRSASVPDGATITCEKSINSPAEGELDGTELMNITINRISLKRNFKFKSYIGLPDYFGGPGLMYDYTCSLGSNDTTHQIFWTVNTPEARYTIEFTSPNSVDKNLSATAIAVMNTVQFFKPLPPPSSTDVEKTRIAFKINPKDVTLSTDKVFKWYDWNKAPEYLKVASGYIHTFRNRQTLKDEILIDKIEEFIKYECKVKIAAVDLDGNGIAGIAIFAEEGSACCGSRGCTLRLYDNGGLTTVDLGTDEVVIPAINGVTASTGRFFPLKSNTGIIVDEKEIMKLFTYDKTKHKQAASEINPTIANPVLKLTPPTSASKN